MKKHELSKRPISKARLARELDTSAGVSYNGTTHKITKAVNGDIVYEHFYMEKGEELSPERKKAIVENADTVLKLLSKEDQQAMRKQIEVYRRELRKNE